MGRQTFISAESSYFTNEHLKPHSQQPGVDFNDTFSPIAKMTAVQLLLALGNTE